LCSVKQQARSRKRLIEQIEIADIGREERTPQLAGLKKQERAIEQIHAASPAAHARHKARQDLDAPRSKVVDISRT